MQIIRQITRPISFLRGIHPPFLCAHETRITYVSRMQFSNSPSKMRQTKVDRLFLQIQGRAWRAQIIPLVDEASSRRASGNAPSPVTVVRNSKHNLTLQATPSQARAGPHKLPNCRNTMSSTTSTNAVDGQYQSMMSSLQHSLGAASIMSPPSTSSVSVSSHPIHRPQHIQSSMSAGTCTEKSSLPSHRRPQRNARFNDQISGVIVPSLEDMSIKERQNVWYSVSQVSTVFRWYFARMGTRPHVIDPTFSLHISA